MHDDTLETWNALDDSETYAVALAYVAETRMKSVVFVGKVDPVRPMHRFPLEGRNQRRKVDMVRGAGMSARPNRWGLSTHSKCALVSICISVAHRQLLFCAIGTVIFPFFHHPLVPVVVSSTVVSSTVVSSTAVPSAIWCV